MGRLGSGAQVMEALGEMGLGVEWVPFQHGSSRQRKGVLVRRTIASRQNLPGPSVSRPPPSFLSAGGGSPGE